ncbi:glycosyltransferase family 2 protein [uncultured Bacteroides sp.]|uniref:glycosyltransferase family 2 protein n=1 Tax=uncultured Bacteroides sp. TaxID=162156 RepID=UPI0025F999C2|nr:glycosyltransferase family 2 protein [uncultured Bacteroides sp.]
MSYKPPYFSGKICVDKIKEMKKSPLVSVIVPNYNYAQYLPMRIESILNQTFTDFELILLDDASTDESISILEEYRNNKYVSHIVINNQNTGSPFQQWMKGISLARGKYVWIAEADDLAEPDFLETCIHLSEKNENTAICYVGSLLIDADGNISPKDINHWGNRKKKGAQCFDGIQFATHNMYWKNYPINASGVLFSRNYALELADTAFQHMRYCGDYLFWFEMSLKGKVIEVYKNLNYFRQHPTKVTNASRTKGGGIMEDIQIVRAMEKKLNNLSNYKKQLRRGLLYRKIKRLPIDLQQKNKLYHFLYETLQAGVPEYRLERWNQILRILIPTLLTSKRDRL